MSLKAIKIWANWIVEILGINKMTTVPNPVEMCLYLVTLSEVKIKLGQIVKFTSTVEVEDFPMSPFYAGGSTNIQISLIPIMDLRSWVLREEMCSFQILTEETQIEFTGIVTSLSKVYERETGNTAVINIKICDLVNN